MHFARHNAVGGGQRSRGDPDRRGGGKKSRVSRQVQKGRRGRRDPSAANSREDTHKLYYLTKKAAKRRFFSIALWTAPFLARRFAPERVQNFTLGKRDALTAAQKELLVSFSE